MLIPHCPNCQHDNKQGERFCVSCGISLDVKPCPACGKLENVRATVCTGCGAHFALIGIGDYKDDPLTTAIPAANAATAGSMRAVPLIVIALAAGGIPLMWLYRHEMPVPKAWQVAPPALAPASISAPALLPAATTPPAPVQTAEPSAGAAVDGASIASAPAPKQATPAARKTLIAKAKHRKLTEQSLDAMPATAAGNPGRPAASPCPEAQRNVGLCD